jgi:hypothetical protein
MMQSNLEIVLLVDDVHGVEVVGQARSNATVPRSATVRSTEEALATAAQWGFPAQGVIVRRSLRSNRHIYKDLLDVAQLESTVRRELQLPWVLSLTLETDMRAHKHLTRMETIAAATKDMAQRYRQRCPQCQAPGFVAVRVVATATCQQCQLPTDVPNQEELECQSCHFKETRTITGARAVVEPGQCTWCNP